MFGKSAAFAYEIAEVSQFANSSFFFQSVIVLSDQQFWRPIYLYWDYE